MFTGFLIHTLDLPHRDPQSIFFTRGIAKRLEDRRDERKDPEEPFCWSPSIISLEEEEGELDGCRLEDGGSNGLNR
jgi:hypothetical protein